MDGMPNVLSKRGLLFKILTWVCTGFIMLGIFLPYAKMGSNSVTTIDVFEAAVDGLGESGAMTFVLKFFLLVLIVIGLAIVVSFYERASFAISVVLISCSSVAGLVYLFFFTSMGSAGARRMKEYKAVGGRIMDVFLILLLIVSVLALVAEIYVKCNNLQAGGVSQHSNGWFCPQCGGGNALNARFCSKCGSAAPVQAKKWFCSQCGTPNEASANFCNKCGTKRP